MSQYFSESTIYPWTKNCLVLIHWTSVYIWHDLDLIHWASVHIWHDSQPILARVCSLVVLFSLSYPLLSRFIDLLSLKRCELLEENVINENWSPELLVSIKNGILLYHVWRLTERNFLESIRFLFPISAWCRVRAFAYLFWTAVLVPFVLVYRRQGSTLCYPIL